MLLRWPAIREQALGADFGHGVHIFTRHIWSEGLRSLKTLAISIHKSDTSERCSLRDVWTESTPHWGQISRLSQHETSHLYLGCFVSQGGKQGLRETPDQAGL